MDVLLGSCQKYSEWLFFLKHQWTCASENSDINFSRTPMDAFEWIGRKL